MERAFIKWEWIMWLLFKKRKYAYQSGTILKGLKWRAKLHPVLLSLIRLNRRFVEKQNLTIIDDKRMETGKPVIYELHI